MKRILILILTLTFAAAAFAAPRQRRPGMSPAALADFLDLTADQKSKITSLREAEKSEIRPLREKLRANRTEIEAALEAGNADKAGELMLASYNIRRQIRTAHQSFRTSVEALLTESQKAKWDTLEELRQLRREHRRPRG